MRKEEERKTRRRNRKQSKSTDSFSDKESIQALRREMHENDATLMKERKSSHNMDPIERRKRWIVAGTAVTAFVTIGVIVIGRPRSS